MKKDKFAKDVILDKIFRKFLNHRLAATSIRQVFRQFFNRDNLKSTSKDLSSIILALGAVFIGLGIFSFTASNSPILGNPIKVLLYIVLMIAFYFGGWLAKEKYNLKRTGHALFLLGAIIYCATIFLIGQMLQIKENWPDGYILSMIGLIIVGFAVKSIFVFYLAIFFGLLAIFSYFKKTLLIIASSLFLIASIVIFFGDRILKKRLSLKFKSFYKKK